MDIARPDIAIKKRKKRIRLTAIAVVVIAAVTVGLSRLKPAVPTVERGLVWIDTVKRGPLVREVRGTGTLIPEDTRIVTTRGSGRVEKILLRPGAPVQPDSVILVLLNNDAEQAALNSELQLKVGEAELENLKFQLQSDVLSAEAAVVAADAAFEQAVLQAEANKVLEGFGAVGSIALKQSISAVEVAKHRATAEARRLVFVKDSSAPRIAAKEAQVDQQRATARQRREEFAGLQVRAGMAGVLQQLTPEIGTQLGSGSVIGRVTDPTRLKATVRVPEVQARDIVIGQKANVDTRNGIMPAVVTRIDPAVVNLTVAVDLELKGPLPRGARPDLSVDGIIELERLNDVVFSKKPALGQEQKSLGVFRLEEDGIYATRVPVKLGRGSVNEIEIVSGLAAGDQVILSDMSQYDAVERIKLK